MKGIVQELPEVNVNPLIPQINKKGGGKRLSRRGNRLSESLLFKVQGGVNMKSMVRSRGISYFVMVLAIMIITIHPVYAQEKGGHLR